MNRTILTWTPEDENDGLDWLFDVHLKTYAPMLRDRAAYPYMHAILFGNEDSPTEVQILFENRHNATYLIFKANADNELRLIGLSA
jgi:hypothetical protein